MNLNAHHGSSRPTVSLPAISALLVLLASCTAPRSIDAAPQAPPETPTAGSADPAAHHGHGLDHGKGPGHGGGSDRATATHHFDDPEKWAKIFDDPARDAWQKPAEVVRALELKPGDTVADLGAGTGYFSRYLSAAVGPKGTVLAADVEPNLIGYIRARAEKEGTPNVVPVLASYDNPRLPPGGVDVLLIVDTFHHIDQRVRYFEQARAVFKPGGRLVVVDFQKRELPVGPGLDHKLDQKQVIGELEQAGYAFVREVTTLPYQYVLVFTPKASRGAGPG